MTREEAIERLEQNKAAAKFYAGMVQNTNAIENELKDIEAMNMAIEAIEALKARNEYADMIYDYLKKKIGSDITDNPFEFEDWFNRMTWHVQECHRLAGEIETLKTQSQKPSAVCDDCIWTVCNYNKVDWDTPSAEAEVSDYAKWLEGIIVKAEMFEWLCEDASPKEWCEENCHYASIQAECLRHIYREDGES